ncbi:hypothetical protein G7074_01040 [Pedobacter sp. HDW13]|uniref:zeta toxin family protein n=1 Tax=unclassified Pedobacter TaxID=2628915 RepID=UPI000F59BF26|nr:MULTISPECIES: zeta toxin family protein [unclassified Pedobacter]QIL37990.1 hypothetical protein G7074_01040 [Pedobacter sp. HDW13]RQO68959.1 hypothetical protein DBR40_18415 [Pedobacter sp. KBW01]
MPSLNKPQLFIITGSNGAGKSTLKQALLPVEFDQLQIFDGDIFFAKKQTEFYQQFKVSKEARKLANEALEEHFLELVDDHIKNHKHFAYEGHFTGHGAWKTPKRFKEAGFEINLVFCGLDHVPSSVKRVDMRVKKNGFHVSPLDIENNFYGNMQMLDDYYPIFHTIEIIDTTGKMLPIFSIHGEDCYSPLSDSELPEWFKRYLPKMYSQLIRSRSID